MCDMAEMPVGMKNLSITIPANVKRYFMRTDNRAELRKILRGAFAVRIVALLIIFLCTPNWSDGFLSSTTYTFTPDDIRYETGAIEYSQTAKALIDPEAFRVAYAHVGDWKGTLPWFEDTPLWYWICCVVIYVTRTKLTLRLLNIIFACCGIKYLYSLAELLFDKKTASLACKLYAFLPYPVLFSCFAYKDHLIFLGTIYLLYVSFLYRYRRKVSKTSVLMSVFMAFCCASMRSGLTFLLILMCLFVAFSQYLKRNSGIFLLCIMIPLFLFFGRDFIAASMESLLYKAAEYQQGRQSFIDARRGISIATISGIRDIYKLPLTFMIAVSMPLKINFQFRSWCDLISFPSMAVMPFVAVGAFLDIFLKKHKDAFFKLILLTYYLACIVTSISYARHYYSILFIPITMCSHYASHISSSNKALWIALSCAYSALLFAYLLFRVLR